ACVAEVGGEWYEITVEEQTRHIIRTRGGAAGGPRSRTLTAALPGKISRVAVGVGDAVRAGDTLVVIEAMKMENEFKATGPGTVAEVRVEAGQTVNAGDVLERHEVRLVNRRTAATFATDLALVSPGDAVLGLSPSYTHPTAIRSARQCGARFVETGGLAGLEAALDREPRVSLVVLTRL